MQHEQEATYQFHMIHHWPSHDGGPALPIWTGRGVCPKPVSSWGGGGLGAVLNREKCTSHQTLKTFGAGKRLSPPPF